MTTTSTKAQPKHPMPDLAAPSSKPVVASYCTTFLKPEMLHIYRQVTGLQRYSTFILTRERIGESQFPFPEIELVPRARKNFVKRFYLKHVRCRDPYFTWLAAKKFAYVGAKFIIKTILGRRPAEIHYLSGVVQGVRGGLKFGVDRATLLYIEEN